MHNSFQKFFETIERQRQSLLHSVGNASPEKINLAPEGKWSIAQILSHIIAAEKMSLQYIKKKIQGVKDAEDTGVKEELKMLLLTISQRLPGLKFKAPRGVVEGTTQLRDVESIKKEWDSAREELYELLKSIPDEHIKRKIYKHVRVGYLNMQHAIKFFGEHVTHHTPQIKRLL